MSFGQRVSPSARAFSCPNCGSPVTLRAIGITVTAVCPACGSVIDTASPELKIIQGVHDALFATPIEIGSRGRLDDIEWEVIGCVNKSVRYQPAYRWQEYLLFNPWHGFRFLSQVNGHWTLFKRLNQQIGGIGDRHSIRLNGRTFSIFNKDNVVVDAVKGEFYWRIKVGDETQASDYISPPYMLSSEENDDEINISLGHYVSQADIRRAFPDARLPYASGVGACQPSGVRNAKSVFKVAAVAAIVAVIAHVAVAVMSPESMVVDLQGQPLSATTPAPSAPMWGADTPAPGAPYPSTATLQLPDFAAVQTAAKTLVSQPFELATDSNLRVDTWTNLDNNWAEFDLSLVNDTTHETFDIHQATSRYSGVDDGERWSEGSNHARNYTPLLPKGHYRLLIDSDTDVFQKQSSLPFTLEIHRGASDIWNLWLTLLVLAIYPIWVAWRVWSFESARWSNSDYSPGGQLLADEDA